MIFYSTGVQKRFSKMYSAERSFDLSSMTELSANVFETFFFIHWCAIIFYKLIPISVIIWNLQVHMNLGSVQLHE